MTGSLCEFRPCEAPAVTGGGEQTCAAPARASLRYSERDLRARAQRVLTGTQSGTWTKIEMARDILALLDRIERMRA